MNLQEQLQKKEEELRKTVEEINHLQQTLNIRNQEALRIDGAAAQLRELIKEEEVQNKGKE